MGIMDREARVTGLLYDYSARSPLSGNKVRYVTPTHVRQRHDRKSVSINKKYFFMTALRMALYIKKGGQFM